MAAIDDYLDRIPNEELREQLRIEVARLTKKKKFGLVYENHLPDNVVMPEVTIRPGTKVALRGKTPNDVYEVQSISDGNVFCKLALDIDTEIMRQCKAGIDTRTAVCRHLVTLEDEVFPLVDLVAVAQRGDVIYPYLKPIDSVQNAPDSDLWHTLIDADNYHALQLLAYLYPGMVDCIYIDPPYNKPDSHDWKYNCDYVDGTDAYRHSKWLSMIEARLKIAKKLLNPKDSVLIVTIDELEYHHLGCLLEQMFPEAKIQMISSIINPGGVPRKGQFYRTNEFIFFVTIGNSQPHPLALAEDWYPGKGTGYAAQGKVRWRTLRRDGAHNSRHERPKSFYPIYLNKECTKIIGTGEWLPLSIDWRTVPKKEDCFTIWPIKPDGSDGVWSISPESLLELFEQGFVCIGHLTSEHTTNSTYLPEGERNKYAKGMYSIISKRTDGSLVLSDSNAKNEFVPGSQWKISNHDATQLGTKLLGKFIGDRFAFPKSLYAVHDTIRFFVANKPNALILDFFAGSGTTLHAVNLLNKEDGGNRRCIMVTNNEIGEPKEKELRPQGIKPGDEDWEKWGIARYVNWPRTKCSILGVDVNGKPIEGEYITSQTETKTTDRKFTQINYMAEGATLKQKKALVTLINKQKDVKLPAMKEDVAFLVSEESDYNASILFDINEAETWMEVLDGNSHITNFYIVAEKDTEFKAVKAQVCDLMGPIEETVPVKMPMKDGFKANAAFFKLGFMDKDAVSLGTKFKEMLTLLWMKSGAKGKCPVIDDEEPEMIITNNFAVLCQERRFAKFYQNVKDNNSIEYVYIVTDSSSGYREMSSEFADKETCQLYKDYLDNFRINKLR